MKLGLKLSGLLAFLLPLPFASAAQEVFSLERFAIPEPVYSYQPDIMEHTRRFTYDIIGETRPQKAVRTFRLALGGIPGELGQIVTFPVRDPKSTAIFLLGTAALIAVDRQTTAFWQDKIEPAFDGFSFPTLFSINNISQETQYVIATVGLTYAGGLAFNDERAQTAALLSTKAIAYSYVTTQLILKPLFGRLRPVDDLTTFTGDGVISPQTRGILAMAAGVFRGQAGPMPPHCRPTISPNTSPWRGYIQGFMTINFGPI